MMLKREATPQKPRSAPWLRRFGAAALATGTALAVAVGCLQRPVEPQDPNTSNLFVDQIVQTAVDKIDLLFMIDNSISMADKQRILRDAVPVLVQRLVTPACVDTDTGEPTGSNTGSGPCPRGSEAEFAAIRDIHIGIVTSSLGDMGSGEACTPGAPPKDDKGQLIATTGLRPMMLNNWNNQGFLAWDPDAAMQRPRNDPPGTTDAQALIRDFSDMVDATGEQGCGYEASLEAWYRFLIDPQPPALVTKDANGLSAAGPPDATILAQRAAFLRPDSLVAIIMLTDENDCSILDNFQGWVVGLQDMGNFFMPRATSACSADPNSKCCFSCSATTNIDPACTLPAADSECAKGISYSNLADDHPNLRCYQQKRRFGFDLLQPLSRYVDGLTRQNIYVLRKPDQNGDNQVTVADAVPNPLFAPKDGKRRDPSLVFLAGIIGVPWQDIADEASWSDPRRLRYLRYDEMVAQGRWDWILSNGAAPPQDGLMFETNVDRTKVMGLPQAHPAGPQVGGKIEASTVTTLANPINGHETNITDGGDLQYACIFPLTEAIPDCNDVGQSGGCDCRDDDQMYNRPLCQGTRQTHAKAFPGTRHLEVLKQVGQITGNSIVASICPRNSMAVGGPANDPNYGYNPAVNAIIDRLKEALKGKCLPRALEVEADGEVPCVVVEARQPAPGATCGSCDGNQALPGRKSIESPAIVPEVHTQLAEGGYCGQAGGPACTDFCLCEISQYTGEALKQCQEGRAEPVDPKGYCYVDGTPAPGEDPNSPALQARREIVANCPASQPRLLRFATDVPQKGAVALIACLGKALGTTTAATP